MTYKLPIEPIQVTSRLLTDPDMAPIWMDRVARIIFLLWKPGHIVNEHFLTDVLSLAEHVKARKAKTDRDLEDLFYGLAQRTTIGGNFITNDVRDFGHKAAPYIFGLMSVSIEIVD